MLTRKTLGKAVTLAAFLGAAASAALVSSPVSLPPGPLPFGAYDPFGDFGAASGLTPGCIDHFFQA